MAKTLALWDASFASSVERVGRVVRLSGGFVASEFAQSLGGAVSPRRGRLFHGGDRSGPGKWASLTPVKGIGAFGARSAHRGPTFAVFGAGRLHS